VGSLTAGLRDLMGGRGGVRSLRSFSASWSPRCACSPDSIWSATLAPATS